VSSAHAACTVPSKDLPPDPGESFCELWSLETNPYRWQCLVHSLLMAGLVTWVCAHLNLCDKTLLA